MSVYVISAKLDVNVDYEFLDFLESYSFVVFRNDTFTNSLSIFSRSKRAVTPKLDAKWFQINCVYNSSSKPPSIVFERLESNPSVKSFTYSKTR